VNNTKSLCGLEVTDPKRVYESSHITVNEDGYSINQGPYPIIHDTGDRIWIASSYSEDWPVDVIKIGDSRNNGYDAAGNCLVSVPVGRCRFYDEKETRNMVALMEADLEMLGWM
jgi:hypothetical protein